MQDKKESQRDISYWMKWIPAAKKAAKDHWEVSGEAHAEYEYSKKRDGGYPIYKTSVDKLESAIFAKLPDPRSRRVFGIDDSMALTMTLINDRLAEHLILDGDALETWEAARSDFVHGSKTAVQVIYSADTEMSRVPLSYVKEGKEESYYEEGKEEAYEGEVESEEGEGGVQYFGYAKKVVEGTPRVRLAACLFDEILHTPEAKCNAEVTEKAYKFCLPYEEAEKRFNSDKKRKLPYKTSKVYGGGDAESSSSEAEASGPGRVLEGWECYCKHTKKIYCVSEDLGDEFLSVTDDVLGLRRFFPSTDFAIINKHRKSLYPSPAWLYLRSTAEQLDGLYGRIFDLVKSIERKAVVYGASDALIKALNSPGLTYVSAGKMMDILDKGGLKELIQFIPVQELVQSLTETIQLEEHFKNNFAEFFHLPDILRGQAEPHQSATQSEILVNEAHDTFKTIKDKFTKMVRDSVELMLDLAYQFYSDQQIAEIVGYEYMPMGDPGVPPTPPSEENPEGDPGSPPVPGHRERFTEALRRLRDDKQRLIRIDFETDSTSFRDDKKDIEKARLIGKTAVDSLSMIAGITNPQFVPIALDMTLAVLESMGGSTQTEDMIRKAVSDLEKAKANPAPPPPDHEMMKLEIKGHEAEIKAQKVALDAQETKGKLALGAQKLTIDEAKTQIKAMESQARVQADMARVEIEKFESQFNAQLEKALVQLEQQRVQIEQYRAEVQAQETLLEEMRLRQEADAALYTQVAEAAEALPPNAPAAPVPQVIQIPAPNMNINFEKSKPVRKTGRITRPDGSVVELNFEVDEMPAPTITNGEGS